MLKKVVCLFIVLIFLVTMVGCGVVPTIPSTPDPKLVLVRVTDPKSNLVSVAGIENEDAMAILGKKDTEGNPTSITGAVYVLEQGDAFGIVIGLDGLPDYAIDSDGNTIYFENYTDSTVDISIYDSDEKLVQEPVTINIEAEDLLEIKQLYDSFYSQQKDAGKNVADDIAAGLRWGAKALPWVGCAITAAGVITSPTTAGLTLLLLSPLWKTAAVACGGTVLTTLVSVSGIYSFTEYEEEAITTAGFSSTNPVDYLSTILYVAADAIEGNWGTNKPPTITSAPITSATVGKLYSYDVDVDDPNDDVLSYSLIIKPSGMEIAPNGFISWIPTESGNFDVKIEVSDGEFSDTQSFTIAVQESDPSIGQVQLSNPYNGSTVNTSTVVLSWNSIANATGYEVVYDTSSNFTNPIGWTVSGTSKTTGTLNEGVTYYWRVRAFVGDQYSSWSSIWSFTKSGSVSSQEVTLVLYIYENSTSGPPLSGVSVGVVDGGGNSSNHTTNSSGYVTITGVVGTWSFSAMKSGYDTNNWTQSITTHCTKYGYLVKSETPVGTIDVFATLDGSPWIGSLSYSLTGPSPSSGSTVPAVLNNKSVGSYSITYNSGGPSNASLASITPSSNQTLSTGGIIAFTLNFVTEEILPPKPPTFLSPGTTSAPGPIISTLTPTLSWQAVPNADYYNLSVSIYPYGTSNIIFYNQQVYGNSITIPSGYLQSGQKYRWNMRAYNSAGYSDYSDTLYFQTGITLGQVQLLGPSNGGLLPPMSVYFWWDSVSNATKYQFILYNSQGQVALNNTYTSTSVFVTLGIEETITWKVRAGDNSGNWGPWSSTWSLTIKSL